MREKLHYPIYTNLVVLSDQSHRCDIEGDCNHRWSCGKWEKRRHASIVWHLLKMLLHTISNSNAPISMTPRHMAILAMLQISIKYSMSIIATYIKRKFFFFWELVQNYRNLQLYVTFYLLHTFSNSNAPTYFYVWALDIKYGSFSIFSGNVFTANLNQVHHANYSHCMEIIGTQHF